MSKQIEALLTERAGYEMRGLKERVALVDAELKNLGFSHKYISPPKEPVIVETASYLSLIHI